MYVCLYVCMYPYEYNKTALFFIKKLKSTIQKIDVKRFWVK